MAETGGSHYSFVNLLTVLLIGLKLAGVGTVATWSWVWVLSPMWIAFLVLLLLGLVVAAGKK